MKPHLIKFILILILLAGQLLAQNINNPNIKLARTECLELNSHSGNMYYQRTDLYIPGQGLFIYLTFAYNSSNTGLDFGYGPRWSMTYLMLYKQDNNSVIVRRGDGRKAIFIQNGVV